MNRRSFIARLVTGVGALYLAPVLGKLPLLEPPVSSAPCVRCEGTRTGRFSCKEPNIQSFTRGDGIYTVPSGYTHVYVRVTGGGGGSGGSRG